MLSERYGGKWVTGVGMLITAIFTLITPMCAEAGKTVLIVARLKNNDSLKFAVQQKYCNVIENRLLLLVG